VRYDFLLEKDEFVQKLADARVNNITKPKEADQPPPPPTPKAEAPKSSAEVSCSLALSSRREGSIGLNREGGKPEGGDESAAS
jgi:hypothetical protein